MVTMAHNANQKTGYKQTEVGVIPEDWEVKKLITVCDYQNGTSLEKYFNNVQGLSVISIGNYSIDGKYIDTNSYIDWKHHDKIKKFILFHNELCMILNDKTSIGAIIGRVLLIKEDNKYVFNQRSMRIVPHEIVSPLYLYYIINSDLLHTKIVSLAKPGTQIYVNTGDITDLDIPIPNSSKEQTAIATALSDVDALIASLDKLITKKRDIKQATMQQLLTGKRRLPGFSGEWEVKKLGEIAEISMGRTPSRRNQVYWGSGYKWLSIADLKSKYVSETKEEITASAASNMTIIPKDTLVMSFKLTIGRLAFTESDMYSNEAICSFQKLQADAEYMYYILGQTDFSLYGKQAVKGYTLNMDSLSSIEILHPTIPEQQAIATVLSDMDAEIVALERRRDKTRALKQGMMQELLTGKTRLR